MDSTFSVSYGSQQDFMMPCDMYSSSSLGLGYPMPMMMDYHMAPMSPKLTVPSQDFAALPYFFTRERFSSSESVGWDQPCPADLMWSSDPRSEMLAKRPRSFQCPVCLKSFDRKFVLKRHMGTHRVDREFSCKPCNMGFYRKDIFDRHIATKKCIRAHKQANASPTDHQSCSPKIESNP
ncbi:hypothetical protein DSO57_1023090 [Entomophthora muscae]|uniref:Uncharacterized protein n=1 Tax=Entomophthora muscae TaxID=34485 RepID=A0ACC2SFI7_9FUNG|nr:hypothetical protein DSO57_1023090 [Entomophthora muscae]